MCEASEKLFGLIGRPLQHSLSPSLHKFILAELKMSGCYHAFEIADSGVEAALKAMQTLGFTGCNVTIPHKQRVMQFLDEVSEEAHALGAVNTVRIGRAKLLGFNTDVAGFKRALRNKNISVTNKSAIILGAGGAARAVTLALIQDGAQRICVFNRTRDRAEKLAAELKQSTGFENFMVNEWTHETVLSQVKEASLMINATSLGMWPDTGTAPFEFAVDTQNLTAVDLVYNPLGTKFLTSAKNAGARIIDGLDMFIFQGIESMQIWTGHNIDIDLQTLRNHLIKKLQTYGQN